MKMKIEAR